MKYLLDNNLPAPLAIALNELSRPEKHTVVHLTEKFPKDARDIDWIQTLHDEGGWVIISQDKFNKSDLEKQAIREAGLLVFCLAKHWSAERYWNKAYNLVRWWPKIVQQSEMLSGGGAFKVPWKYGHAPKFEQIKF
ncbi:hypothetical protein EZI54_17900 [Marinobacter halodurans]|uniref:VapC45 PIN like domain-containing protein n=1 Tax=Marinobacter halodurans TaxID=2528979 RepID=A0ABY1ZG98_9GAMM|nr:hypothetical protein [Marinobacter halodurans]TBW50772.1 hypothetical protein EZI54_17900 [Marinobacter halodurans]